MTPADREQVRLSLLRYLDANAGNRFGLSQPAMVQRLASEGFRLSMEELMAELEYLKGKGFAEIAGKPISPEVRTWKITATGRDQYAEISGT